jgi:hypothetical protein
MMSVQEKVSDAVFEEMIERADLRLFEKITSQTSDSDKTTLLAAQRATRNMFPSYTYLEIGSYLGGSLQPFVLDENCRQIYSIDKRPGRQPDERGVDYIYKNNSTERMLENLKRVSPRLDKIVCLDGDAGEIDKSKIAHQPDLCFIDGEHTDEACQRDFHFCFEVMNKQRGAILFHDAAIVYNALHHIVEFLQKQKCEFNAYALPDVMFAIEIGDFPLHREPAVARMLINNHVPYLVGLRSNDYYRTFINKPIFKKYRSLVAWWEGSNVSE